MDRSARERAWTVIAEIWMQAALGERPPRTALDDVLDVASKTFDVTFELLVDGDDDASARIPIEEVAAATRYRLGGGGGEIVGSLAVFGSIAPADGQRLALVAGRLLDLPNRVTLSRGSSHDLANKLASLLANSEHMEWLTRTHADDPETLHQLAHACLEVTRELILSVSALQMQRDRR